MNIKLQKFVTICTLSILLNGIIIAKPSTNNFLENKKQLFRLLTQENQLNDQEEQTIKNILKKNPTLIHQKNEKGDTPLYLACQKNLDSVVQFLIKHKAHVNVQNIRKLTPLHAAAENNAYQSAKLLIDAGAHINAQDKNGYTPLAYAGLFSKIEQHSRADHFAVAKLLINNGANLNIKDYSGDTMLCSAITLGELSFAQLLIQSGANLYAYQDNHHSTVLHLAATHDSFIDIVKLLLDTNLDINTQNDEGMTPLHCAVINNAVKIAQLLIHHNANVNLQTNKGNTPLHLAVSNEAIEELSLYANPEDKNIIAMLEILVNAGADMTIKNHEGKTPFAVAQENFELTKYNSSRKNKVAKQMVKFLADQAIAQQTYEDFESFE